MRTLYISHLRSGQPKRSLFGKVVKTDYFSHDGLVREFSCLGKTPTYRLIKPLSRRKILVKFV
jgi:hypothetical protein